MNNNYISITGKVNIPTPLDVDRDYQFTGNIATYAVNKSSKQDGTYNVTFKARFTDGIFLIAGEEVIKATEKVSKSQKWRNLCFAKGYDYTDVMNWMMANSEDIFDMYTQNL